MWCSGLQVCVPVYMPACLSMSSVCVAHTHIHATHTHLPLHETKTCTHTHTCLHTVKLDQTWTCVQTFFWVFLLILFGRAGHGTGSGGTVGQWDREGGQGHGWAGHGQTWAGRQAGGGRSEAGCLPHLPRLRAIPLTAACAQHGCAYLAAYCRETRAPPLPLLLRAPLRCRKRARIREERTLPSGVRVTPAAGTYGVTRAAATVRCWWRTHTHNARARAPIARRILCWRNAFAWWRTPQRAAAAHATAFRSKRTHCAPPAALRAPRRVHGCSHQWFGKIICIFAATHMRAFHTATTRALPSAPHRAATPGRIHLMVSEKVIFRAAAHACHLPPRAMPCYTLPAPAAGRIGSVRFLFSLLWIS